MEKERRGEGKGAKREEISKGPLGYTDSIQMTFHSFFS